MVEDAEQQHHQNRPDAAQRDETEAKAEILKTALKVEPDFRFED